MRGRGVWVSDAISDVSVVLTFGFTSKQSSLDMWLSDELKYPFIDTPIMFKMCVFIFIYSIDFKHSAV